MELINILYAIFYDISVTYVSLMIITFKMNDEISLKN
jgi:hypothetical protein